MRLFRFLFLLAFGGAALATARAAEPVTVTLHERAAVGKLVVTLGDVALITGGDAAARAKVARIDLAELKSREPSTTIGRKSVEYRLLLAGVDASVAGADRTSVTLSRRAVTVEEVTEAARAELHRQLPNPESVVVELALPIVAKLPEVPADERATITAKARGKPGPSGRVQMDMAIAAGGETLLSFAIHLSVQPAVRPAGAQSEVLPPLPAIAPVPPSPRASQPTPAPATSEILIRPRQRVEMQVNSGALKVTAVGESLQAGKLGQTILVQNVDSKKTLSARVTGPGTVEVDLGGSK